MGNLDFRISINFVLVRSNDGEENARQRLDFALNVDSSSPLVGLILYGGK